jgi:hypothetical protein
MPGLPHQLNRHRPLPLENRQGLLEHAELFGAPDELLGNGSHVIATSVQA